MSIPKAGTTADAVKNFLGLPSPKRGFRPASPPYVLPIVKPDDPLFMKKVARKLLDLNLPLLASQGYLDLDKCFQTTTDATLVTIRDTLSKLTPPVTTPYCGRMLFLGQLLIQKVENMWQPKFLSDDQKDETKMSMQLEINLYSGKWYADQVFDYFVKWPAAQQAEVRNFVKEELGKKYKDKLPSPEDTKAFIEKELEKEVAKYFKTNLVNLKNQYKTQLEEAREELENSAIQLYIKTPKSFAEQFNKIISELGPDDENAQEYSIVGDKKVILGFVGMMPECYLSKANKFSINMTADDILFIQPKK